MGGYNMRWQFQESIKNAEAYGESKHSAKHNGNVDTGDKIYSMQSQKNIRETANQFADFCKKEYKEVRLAKDINSEMANKFLENKSYSCNQNTIYRYKSELNKLQNLINKKFCKGEEIPQWNLKMPEKFNDFKTTMLREFKQKDIWMDPQDLVKIKNHISENSRSKSLLTALELSEILGTRVGEVVDLRASDFKFKSDCVEVNIKMHDDTKKGEGPKGGRPRNFTITSPQEVEKLKEIISTREGNERLLGVGKGALDKGWERLPRELTQKYIACGSSFHSIRKMKATQIYENALSKALSKYGDNEKKAYAEALRDLNNFLGHGALRDLRREYVKSK